jgi:uncharacterized protein (TIGR02284 family)
MDQSRIVAVLRNVSAHCHDNVEGYRSAAQDMPDSSLKTEFDDLVQRRTAFTQALDNLIRFHGGEPPAERGTALGTAFRGYMRLRSAIASNSRQAILEEIARGEGIAEAVYDRALMQDLPAEARETLRTQHDEVRQSRDRFRSLAGLPQGAMAEKAAAATNTIIQERPMIAGLIAAATVGVLAGAVYAGMGRSSGQQKGRGRRAGAVRQVMTRTVRIASPDQTIAKAAQDMAELETGVLPVGENDRLVGMITDRDIAIRAVAKGLGGETRIREVMTPDVKYCFDDQPLEEVARYMSDVQVRRLPVLDRNKRIVGVVSLGDLSQARGESAHEALRGVSRPGGEHRQSMAGMR